MGDFDLAAEEFLRLIFWLEELILCRLSSTLSYDRQRFNLRFLRADPTERDYDNSSELS